MFTATESAATEIPVPAPTAKVPLPVIGPPVRPLPLSTEVTVPPEFVSTSAVQTIVPVAERVLILLVPEQTPPAIAKVRVTEPLEPPPVSPVPAVTPVISPLGQLVIQEPPRQNWVELVLPITSNFWLGAVVPMPTLPALDILIAGVTVVDPIGTTEKANPEP